MLVLCGGFCILSGDVHRQWGGQLHTVACQRCQEQDGTVALVACLPWALICSCPAWSLGKQSWGQSPGSACEAWLGCGWGLGMGRDHDGGCWYEIWGYKERSEGDGWVPGWAFRNVRCSNGCIGWGCKDGSTRVGAQGGGPMEVGSTEVRVQRLEHSPLLLPLPQTGYCRWELLGGISL